MTSKPFIIMIFPGPTYRPRESFEKRLNGLSDRYKGIVVTSRPTASAMRVSNFSIVSVRAGSFKLAKTIRVLYVIYRIVRSRRAQPTIDLVVSYDPLSSGLIGLVVSTFLKCALSVEVNGDYSNPLNYLEIKNPIKRFMKRRMAVAAQKFVLSRADGIKLQYDTQINSLGLDKNTKSIRTFPNLVPINYFVNISDDPVILSVGFPMHVKGMDILINAFKKISERHPAWYLKILGHYPNPTVLNAAIDNHPRIRVLPPVHRLEVPNYIGRCGIFALVSRTEGVARVLIEAMAAGKPRIGTSVGGTPNVINHNVDGLLVPPSNINAVSEALEALITDKGLRDRLGAAAAKRAETEFPPQRYFERTYEYYDSSIQIHSA